MKKTKLALCSSFSVLLLAATSAQAQTTWTGGNLSASTDFFNPDNWDDGIGPDADFDPNTPISPEAPYPGNIIVANAVGTLTAGAKLRIASGFSMTISNSTVTFLGASNWGIEGNTTDADDDSVVNLSNSTLSVQSVAKDMVVNVDSSSTLRLNGAGNAINGNGTLNLDNNTQVNLGDGGQLVFLSGCTNTSVDQRIIRTVSGVSFETDFATLPLEDFLLSGPDTNPFDGVNEGTFTIAGYAPPPPAPTIFPDTMVGIAMVDNQNTPGNPNDDIPFWLRTRRTATDWQYDVHFADSVFYGWAGIAGHDLADINGDGLDDKIIWQNQGLGLQLLGAYTFPGNFTNTDFMGAGDFDSPWWDNVNMKPCFGDLDGDGIDDSMVTVEATDANVGSLAYIPGVAADGIYWAAWNSQGVAGISNNLGGSVNFSGWSPFGQPSLGDKPFLGDFNGDGVVDRAIHRTSTNQVFLCPGNPAGGWAFTIIGPIQLGTAGAKITASDINGDGYDDLVVILDPGFYNAGLQEMYGYLNDQNNFFSLTGAPLAPNGLPFSDFVDIFGSGVKMLFGKLGPVDDFSAMKITSFAGGGANQNIAITYNAPLAGYYTTQVSLDMVSWFGVGVVENVSVPPYSAYSLVTDGMLDVTFPGTDPRPKVFVRVKYSPNP